MFELKFAAEVSDLTGTWAVGVLALVYGQYYSGITLPALAEESGPGISSQPFPHQLYGTVEYYSQLRYELVQLIEKNDSSYQVLD